MLADPVNDGVARFRDAVRDPVKDTFVRHWSTIGFHVRHRDIASPEDSPQTVGGCGVRSRIVIGVDRVQPFALIDGDQHGAANLFGQGMMLELVVAPKFM